MESRRLVARIAPSAVALLALGCGHFQAKKDQSLIAAIAAGSPAKVQEALRRGANPNASINDEKTNPLLFAIATKNGPLAIHEDIIETLLAAGADPSKRQRDGMDGLYLAANMGDADLCERFCKMGLSPVRPDYKGISPLQIAAVGGDVRCITAMLSSIHPGQIDTPSSGEHHSDSALGFACANGRLEVATLLLDHGANPNFQGQQSLNPLISASIVGNYELVELLLSRGAKVDLPFRNGGTALAIASLNGNVDIMKVLIAHGANVDHQNKSGVTPMMDAAKEGHHDAVELLVKSGARADIQDKKGRTAADYAQAHKSGSPGSAPESAGG